VLNPPSSPTTTTTGQTSVTELGHTAEIVERHQLLVMVPADVVLLGGTQRDEVLASCFRRFSAWCKEEGLDPELIDASIIDRADPPSLGIVWEVILGKGKPDGTDDWAWTWSARIEQWSDMFSKGVRRTRRIIARPKDGMASVTSIARRDNHRSLIGTGTSPAGPAPTLFDAEEHMRADDELF
jgi:hypothetical protein